MATYMGDFMVCGEMVSMHAWNEGDVGSIPNFIITHDTGCSDCDTVQAMQ